MHEPSVLILTPDLSVDGGVTNYYRTLGMDVSDGVQYFTVSGRAGRSSLVRVPKLAITYFRFAWVSPKYSLIHVNPTFDPRSYYRDMVFVLIALLDQKVILLFFRGWVDSLEARVGRSVWLSRLFLRTYGTADPFCALGKVFAAKLRALSMLEKVAVNIVSTVADSSRIATLRLEEEFNSYRDEVAVLSLPSIIKTKTYTLQ